MDTWLVSVSYATNIQSVPPRIPISESMYTVVNSRAYDPENLKTGLMNWQILAIVIDIILGALVIFLEVLTIRKYKKDAAEEPVQTVNETSAE